MLISLIVLAGCGNTSSSGGPTTPAKIHLTVGGKLDTEAQLITEMYVLLLQKAGFDVTPKLALGTNAIVFNAITSGQIDLYPEFTATGLAKLGLNSSGNAAQDYQTVKQGFEQKYQITWLNAAPLNDTYGVCTLQTAAAKLGVTMISQLGPVASQLTVATPPDGIKFGVDAVKTTYGFSLKYVSYNEEALTFPAVLTGKQQLNICYTTSALIAKDSFVVLQDDKNAFPVYNPAPIVRDDTLKRAPGIAAALNPLAPKLTTEVSQQLQLEVANGQTVEQVATAFLKSVGLL